MRLTRSGTRAVSCPSLQRLRSLFIRDRLNGGNHVLQLGYLTKYATDRRHAGLEG